MSVNNESNLILTFGQRNLAVGLASTVAAAAIVIAILISQQIIAAPMTVSYCLMGVGGASAIGALAVSQVKTNLAQMKATIEIEEPKVEAPKVEAPKVEVPKMETSKVETTAALMEAHPRTFVEKVTDAEMQVAKAALMDLMKNGKCPLVDPSSMLTAISMLLLLKDEKIQKEFLTKLLGSEVEAAQFHTFYSERLKTFELKGKALIARNLNGFYLDQGPTSQQKALLDAYYEAYDYSGSINVKGKINFDAEWFSNGKIKQFFDEEPENVFFNICYILASWEQAFDGPTKNGQFTTEKGEKVPCKMMQTTARGLGMAARYTEKQGLYKGVFYRFKRDSFSNSNVIVDAFFLLPSAGKTALEVLERLDPDFIMSKETDEYGKVVSLSLPKLKIDSWIETEVVRKLIAQMGFNLQKLDREGRRIEFQQKLSLSVNENGIEYAVASAAGVPRSLGVKVNLVFDRPFIHGLLLTPAKGAPLIKYMGVVDGNPMQFDLT